MKVVVAFVAGLIAAPVLLALAAMAGWVPSIATSDPPKWETALGFRALDGALEKRSAGLKNPIASTNNTALAAGEDLYGDNCVSCHGDAKAPSRWGSRGFYPRAPQFWQGKTEVSPEEAYAAIHDGIRYTGMGAWHAMMTDQEIWQVANFVSRINKRAPKEQAAARN
jgi:mono/diheme cytochrome c family protein